MQGVVVWVACCGRSGPWIVVGDGLAAPHAVSCKRVGALSRRSTACAWRLHLPCCVAGWMTVTLVWTWLAHTAGAEPCHQHVTCLLHTLRHVWAGLCVSRLHC